MAFWRCLLQPHESVRAGGIGRPSVSGWDEEEEMEEVIENLQLEIKEKN